MLQTRHQIKKKYICLKTKLNRIATDSQPEGEQSDWSLLIFGGMLVAVRISDKRSAAHLLDSVL